MKQMYTGEPVLDTKKVQAPAMESHINLNPVDVSKYDYSTGKTFDYDDKQQHTLDQVQQKYASPYRNKSITPSNWRSPDKKYNDLDRSELAYDNTGAAYFDNTFMRKRYGNDVHQPRTPQERYRQGMAVQKHLLGTKDTVNPDLLKQKQYELAVQKHQQQIKEHQDSLGKGNYKARYSDVMDDNFNVVGSRFDGSFDAYTGIFRPANQPKVQLTPQEITSAQQAYQTALRDGSPEVIQEFMQLLEANDLTLEDIGVKADGQI